MTTAIPYGCNDKIDGVGILSSPRCSTVNTLQLFNTSARRNRSHGHRKYIPPAVHTVTIDSLLTSVQKPLGIHHIRTKLYSISLSKLSLLFQEAQNTSVTDSRSVLYRLVAIIMDIANHRLFKPVLTTSNSEEKRYFFKVEFANKGLDAVNISNIFHQKSVQKTIPDYFKNKAIPVISYTYTTSIASKIFNHKIVFEAFNLKDRISKLPDCSCASSQYNYSPAGHIITGDLGIVTNEQLRELLAKGPKYRIPQPINWKKNFKLLMDAVENYARK